MNPMPHHGVEVAINTILSIALVTQLLLITSKVLEHLT